jgi:hypothetical protein
MTFAFLGFTALRIFQRRSYELFLKLHTALTLLIMVTTWLHIKSQIRLPFTFNVICLLTASILMAITLVLQAVKLLCRNSPGPLPTVTVHEWGSSKILEVSVKGVQRWKVKPGQYIYLTVPAAGSWSFAEAHPFCVVWWWDPEGRIEKEWKQSLESGLEGANDNEAVGEDDKTVVGDNEAVNEDDETVVGDNEAVDEDDGTARRYKHHQRSGIVEDKFQLWLLVKQRTRWTRSLADFKSSHELLAMVEGPYGPQQNLRDYGHVVMFATSMGMAALLPYVRCFLYGTIFREFPTRQIAVFWELEQEG